MIITSSSPVKAKTCATGGIATVPLARSMDSMAVFTIRRALSRALRRRVLVACIGSALGSRYAGATNNKTYWMWCGKRMIIYTTSNCGDCGENFRTDTQ